MHINTNNIVYMTGNIFLALYEKLLSKNEGKNNLLNKPVKTSKKPTKKRILILFFKTKKNKQTNLLIYFFC